MTKLCRLIVTWKSTVCLDMQRNADGSWKTLVKRPIHAPRRAKPKSKAWKRLVRLHRRGLRK